MSDVYLDTNCDKRFTHDHDLNGLCDHTSAREDLLAKQKYESEACKASPLHGHYWNEVCMLPNSLVVAESVPEESTVPGLPPEFVELSAEALRAFAEGYAEYGPHAADAQGLAGQWGELWRKTMKLRRSMWIGEMGRLTRETEREVLKDIMGHCLLAIEMIDRGFDGGRK